MALAFARLSQNNPLNTHARGSFDHRYLLTMVTFTRTTLSMQTTEQEETRYSELQLIALDAARNGERELLVSMLDAGLPIELRDHKGNSLLMLSAYHNQEVVVNELLKRGANPDSRNDRNQTPLAGVAFKGHYLIAKRLIQGGADPVADQGGGKTPAMFAAMFGNDRIYQLIQDSIQKENRHSWLWKLLAFLTSKIKVIFFQKAPKPNAAQESH